MTLKQLVATVLEHVRKIRALEQRLADLEKRVL
jgi:hypothetical protein